MTTGEKLLNLTIEYQESLANRSGAWGVDGKPAGREPSEIAADYEAAMRDLIVPAST